MKASGTEVKSGIDQFHFGIGDHLHRLVANPLSRKAQRRLSKSDLIPFLMKLLKDISKGFDRGLRVEGMTFAVARRV